MNDRDYLRSLGFTVGERGRFSKEMLAELAIRVAIVETNDLLDEVETNGLPPAVAAKPTRQPEILHGWDREGNKIAFVMCSQCAEHMMWCECPNGILAPSYIVKVESPLARVA